MGWGTVSRAEVWLCRVYVGLSSQTAQVTHNSAVTLWCEVFRAKRRAVAFMRTEVWKLHERYSTSFSFFVFLVPYPCPFI